MTLADDILQESYFRFLKADLPIGMDDAWRTELSWSGWGDPAQATELPEGMSELLRTGLGVTTPTPVPASISSLELSPIRLAPDTAEALVSIVGADHGRFDHETRARHALGRSLFDLLALRSVRTIEAPDVILFPGSHDEVQAVLALCSEQRVAVVPFGGGTSVVGGLSPEAGAFEGLVALDLRRLDQLVALDRESRTATLGAGLRGPDAEAALQYLCSNDVAAPTPRRCWTGMASRSATSRSRMSTPPWAASPRPAPADRRRPATDASTNSYWG